MASELALRSEKIKKLVKANENINRDLIETQATITTLQSCNRELMQKIQILQDANDKLTIQIEGFKSQCDNNKSIVDCNVLMVDTSENLTILA